MKKIFLSALALCFCLMAGAQQVEQLPIDSTVRVGHLDNGLTYYIRHNDQPKQRAEFHIAQAVGAILEEDSQNGLAHFLEHMAFNGTQHFPGKGIINYFESIGVNFGGNINAYTSLDETVYYLSEVPTYREGIIDSALFVMHDWACGLLLEDEEIDAERGVIREEWRTRSEANRRMWTAMNPLIYPGSQYAKRDVIGDTAVINNFPYDTLRAYYKKWYGPDNQAIFVIGDIDPDQIEAKIKALWADVPARVNRGERPVYPIFDNEEPIVGIVKDKEAQYTRVTFDFKKDVLPANLLGTNIHYSLSVVAQLVSTMLNNRFEELYLDPNASFIGCYAHYTNLVKSKDAFEAIYVAKSDKEKQAISDLVFQLEKMRRYGFTNAELERAKTEMLASAEKAYNERNALLNRQLVGRYRSHFLDHEPIPGEAWEYETLKQILPMMDVRSINQLAQSMVTKNNLIVAISGPESAAIPTKDEVLDILSAAESLEIEAPVEEAIRTTLVEHAPKAGKIKKETKNASLGTTEWMLSNGIKVVIKPTEFKKDEILFSASSLGGTSQVTNPDDLPSATMATWLISLSGIGDFNYSELQKALTGKVVNLSPDIDNSYESMEGSSSVRDLETMLQLAYLYFTAPRRDEQAFQTLIGLLQTQIKNKEANPKAIWNDSIAMMRCNYSPRAVLMNEETLAKVDLDKAMKFYTERFANPADFIITFTGNVHPEDEAFRTAVCTWLGGLKTNGKKEKVLDTKVRAPQGVNKNYFTRGMQTKTASNFIQYTTYNVSYNWQNNIAYRIIGKILDIRYLESIREREGGTYGVGVYSVLNRYPVNHAILLMQFDTDPDKQAHLMDIIHEEVKLIADNGPLELDLTKVKNSMLKDFDENLEKNSYWSSTILQAYYFYGINFVEDYRRTVESIDAATIRKVAQEFVSCGNTLEVVMLPK